MSEFEFEKLCRGVNDPVTNEFAWSSPDFIDVDVLLNDGLPNETADTSGGGLVNVLDGSENAATSGPFRTGFPATPSTTMRIQVGGGFYGAMELSGNVAERVVSAFNNDDCSQVHGFDRAHGNGEILGSGFTDVLTWPSTNIPNAIEPFAGIRGGAWNQPADRANVSDRMLINQTARAAANLFGRRAGLGGRGVRRAPNPADPSTF